MRQAGMPAIAKSGRRACELRCGEEEGLKERTNDEGTKEAIRQMVDLSAKRAIGEAGLPT